MTDETIIEEEVQEDSSVLGMSDEDLLNMPIPEVPEIVAEETNEDVEDDNQEDTSTEEETADTTDQSDTEENTEETSETETTEQLEANSESTNEETAELDYKREYEKLTAPFRANGKDIQVANVNDAITLMQQGANYNKKMAGLKPNLKLMKMLENNDLLDESKLSFLIDLNQKNPEAVKKFIKDSGIDPLEIDTEETTEYTPNTYTVNDKELELDSVLDDIRDTQSFNSTVDIISNKWDASSKKVLIEEPSLIKVINDHVSMGIYDQITHVIENERMLGRLQGLSDIEAYKQVGDAIQAVGGFNKPKADNVLSEKPVNKAQDDPTLKSRKKAASPTKSAPSRKAQSNFNPLSISDEEFEKIANSNYM